VVLLVMAASALAEDPLHRFISEVGAHRKNPEYERRYQRAARIYTIAHPGSMRNADGSPNLESPYLKTLSALLAKNPDLARNPEFPFLVSQSIDPSAWQNAEAQLRGEENRNRIVQRRLDRQADHEAGASGREFLAREQSEQRLRDLERRQRELEEKTRRR